MSPAILFLNWYTKVHLLNAQLSLSQPYRNHAFCCQRQQAPPPHWYVSAQQGSQSTLLNSCTLVFYRCVCVWIRIWRKGKERVGRSGRDWRIGPGCCLDVSTGTCLMPATASVGPPFNESLPPSRHGIPVSLSHCRQQQALARRHNWFFLSRRSGAALLAWSPRSPRL